MLLFTKKIHANRLRSGRKTIELRSGSRYRNVAVNDELSINGYFKIKVLERFELLTPQDAKRFIKTNFYDLGFNSFPEARVAIADCYPDVNLPFYAWRVSLMISSSRLLPLFDQQTSESKFNV